MRYILAMWDSGGFEALRDITQYHPENWDKANVISALRGEPVQANPLMQDLFRMKMRAQANMHRSYEIYVFTMEDNIEFRDIEDWMIADPQSLVNWIRINHWSKIYSDYRPQHRKVIE